MHMADAIISPEVAGTMLAVTVGIAAYSIRKVQKELDDKKIPLMGVMGAFVFAIQMINFTIPGTGSSGHIGGGMLLCILLGPYAGFLTMASILLIQALFFADGGLLAYGCNVFNLSFFACFIAYPFIYKGITRKVVSPRRIFAATIVSVVMALQLGSFSVVLESLFSGKTELPFTTFALLMQSIHLIIGVIEGLVTAAIITFVWQARPEILDSAAAGTRLGNVGVKRVLAGLTIAAMMIGGGLSWFASANPDGLEWSIKKAGITEMAANDQLHQAAAALQHKTAFLPGYSLGTTSRVKEVNHHQDKWPAVNSGTSVAGLVGGGLTLALVAITGMVIGIAKRKSNKYAA